MQKISNIRQVHIELTDKCQAQCPMCARNFHGGPTRPFIKNGDITIDQFREWFPKEFLSQLTNFYSCGNYGDPAFARDCLEIFSYVRECNPTTRLALHTNGGMRNPDWWSRLATVLGSAASSEAVFAVDGFKGKHELYRKNTNFDKVIENMTAFIQAGGRARVDSLVFAHNEHDVEELEKYLRSLGANSVNFISTTRFYEMESFPVHDLDSQHIYDLKPAQRIEFKRNVNNSLDQLVDQQFRNKVLGSAEISPLCEIEQGIYVDPYGNILPCCWIGSDYLEEPIEEILPIHYLRNLSVQNTKDMLQDIAVPNCQDRVLYNSNDILWPKLSNYWSGENKCMTCVKVCSKALYNSRKNNE